jgi:type IV secretory pathway VirB10-like protein
MRNFLLLSIVITAAALTLGACASSDSQRTSSANAEAMPTATVRAPSQSAQATTDAPPVSVGHATPTPSSGASPQPGAQSGTADTAALDKKVEQAEAKAKDAKATQADKQAAAAAYLERGNFFYNAGNPSFYKFALRDFRRTLRYDPNNEEARSKQQQITDIYQSMNRPVPELGNEP